MREQFIRNKRIIIHYYIVAGFVAMLFYSLAKRDELMDPTILMILAIYMLVFPVVILFTRKYAVHIFLFSLAFITGFYGFYYYSAHEHSVWNALYFTFQLYILEVPDVFTPDGSGLLHYPLIIEVARWSAALYTISTVFIAMYRILEMSILLVFNQVVGSHLIIFGYNKNSIEFIENVRKNKKRVILIASRIPNEVVDYLEELRVVVLSHHDYDESIYTKSGIARAEHVVLFYERDADNLNELVEINYHFKNHPKRSLDPTIHVHLQNPTSIQVFYDLIKTVQAGSQPFTIKHFNLYELFVDSLFERHPIYPREQKSTPLHVLLVGFGSLGQHIALKVIRESEQLEDDPPFITAVDQAMNQLKQQWKRDYGGENDKPFISYYSFDVTKESLETWIQNQSKPITHIYVCLHEDQLDLWTGIELSTQFPQLPIFLEFREGSIAEKWIQSEVSGTRQIYSIGTFNDILTEEKLLDK